MANNELNTNEEKKLSNSRNTIITFNSMKIEPYFK